MQIKFFNHGHHVNKILNQLLQYEVFFYEEKNDPIVTDRFRKMELYTVHEKYLSDELLQHRLIIRSFTPDERMLIEVDYPGMIQCLKRIKSRQSKRWEKQYSPTIFKQKMQIIHEWLTALESNQILSNQQQLKF